MNKFLAVAAILTLCTSAFASPTGGEATASGTLDPQEVKEYHVELRGEENWSLFAKGLGGGDLDCAVFDENGGNVGSDTDSTNVCVINGNPKWTGLFTVKVANHGARKIAFSVKIN